MSARACARYKGTCSRQGRKGAPPSRLDAPMAPTPPALLHLHRHTATRTRTHTRTRAFRFRFLTHAPAAGRGYCASPTLASAPAGSRCRGRTSRLCVCPPPGANRRALAQASRCTRALTCKRMHVHAAAKSHATRSKQHYRLLHKGATHPSEIGSPACLGVPSTPSVVPPTRWGHRPVCAVCVCVCVCVC